MLSWRESPGCRPRTGDGYGGTDQPITANGQRLEPWCDVPVMIARLIASVALLLIATTVPPAQAAKEVDRDAKRDMVGMTDDGFRDEPEMRSGDITRFTTLHGT